MLNIHIGNFQITVH